LVRVVLVTTEDVSVEFVLRFKRLVLGGMMIDLEGLVRADVVKEQDDTMSKGGRENSWSKARMRQRVEPQDGVRQQQ
jgi:hypothetical protein